VCPCTGPQNRGIIEGFGRTGPQALEADAREG
jgi:hypothetical protein